ncbi:hypothetical protein NJ959_00360 [Symplocastrum sp. BBK-W-15]|uniref:Uncharacterized protein n=1 Tax=Limnofasciculus baicalensis BBK-W-15 TaxID=2699891 RepID=A0AAE3KJU7_9CYAN|nr:hypothetical protein [Limnofasciculus baicalensis BBK-W-15]
MTISIPIRFPTAPSVALAPKQSNSFLPSLSLGNFGYIPTSLPYKAANPENENVTDNTVDRFHYYSDLDRPFMRSRSHYVIEIRSILKFPLVNYRVF